MLSDEDFRQLLAFLDRPYAGFRKVRKGVKKRVRRHMQALGCSGIDDYLVRIEQDPKAHAECERCLIVTISRFFRDRRLWEHLRSQALPGLMQRFPEGLTAWSAGCAGGEEPYSLAMIWREIAAETDGAAPRLQILATDADPAGLDRARAGIYPESSLKEIPEAYQNRWFQRVGGGRRWRIDPSLRGRIRWQAHQLLDGPPRDAFHVIFLRNNLLTYYQGTAMSAALGRIVETLAAGGLLIVGSHERPPATDFPLIRDEDCPWIFQKHEIGLSPT